MRTAQEAPAQAASQQVDRDVPVRGELAQGDGGQPGGQRDQYDDQAHRLVHDNRRQGGEAEQADQQRQPELRAAQADHAAQRADRRAGGEGQRQGTDHPGGHGGLIIQGCQANWLVSCLEVCRAR
jgi:hypothetical protein